MASTLRTGSSGSEVAELQRLLNATGNYSLATDGIFGSLTEQAVRDYQARSGLAIDGIAGVNTWGSLTTPQAQTSAPAVNNTDPAADRPVYTQGQAVTDAATKLAQTQAAAPGEYEQSQAVTDAINLLMQHNAAAPGEYEQSQAVKDAADLLAQRQASAPGEYTSQYGDQIQSLIDGIMNRPKFNYDVAADPLYQQYSDLYQRSGERAMMDAQGQAAQLTGGYGNSYASTAGQQAYQNMMQEKGAIIPELQQAAYGMYANQGNDMRSNLGMMQGMEATAYGQHRDAVGDYRAEVDYYTGRHDTAYNRDYGQYRDEVGDHQSQAAYLANRQDQAYNQDYGQYRDLVGDHRQQVDYQTGRYDTAYNQDYGQYQDTVDNYERDRAFAYQQQQDAISQQQWQQEYNLAVAAAAKKSSSGGSKKATGDAFLESLANNPNLTDAQRTAMANQYYGLSGAAEPSDWLKKAQSAGKSLGR